MFQYREEVSHVLEVLSYITSPSDPNGLDLWFTTMAKRQKPKTNAEMLSIFRKVMPEDYSDMKLRFGNIISDYYKSFGKTHRLRSLVDRSQPLKGPRKLSLYVLTDGVWQGKTDLKPIITDLVGEIQKHELVHNQVGIQFIRFGNDTREQGRLEELDQNFKEEVGLYVYPNLRDDTALLTDSFQGYHRYYGSRRECIQDAAWCAQRDI